MDSMLTSTPGGDEDERTLTRLPTPFQTLAGAIREGNYSGGELQAGERVHHYKIVEPIGRGGMGAVFIAEHIYLKQRVALKTLNAQYRDIEVGAGELAERFLREAQALAILSGPNVLAVQDASVFKGVPYVVTELLLGQTLKDHLRAQGQLTIHQTMNLLEQLGEVLIRQEKFGVLHRDIKPSNVWVRNDGTFCLIDYGLVGFANDGPTLGFGGNVATMVGSVMGTPLYMAPEQATHGRVDHRTDLFGLGLTAWECLTGVSPRKPTADLGAIMRQVLREPIPPVNTRRPEVSDELSAILASLTASSTDDRYRSARKFVDDLEGFRYGGRRPTLATRGTAFIATPFHPAFDELFEFLRETCAEARLAARRVDRSISVREIWHQIDHEIRNATVVLAVFTRERWHREPNPNVVTEAAYARALARPLIVLTTDHFRKLPFDWRHLPVLRYTPNKAGLQALKESLLPRLRAALREDS